MANVLSSLMVTLGADTAAFQQDMGKAGQTAKTEFEKITDGAKAMGAALAAAFTLGAIKDGVLQAVDFADAMGDMAARTGQSVESLTAMGYAAKFSGSSVETYSAGIEKLSDNIASAAAGNDAAAQMFGRLGVSVRDSNGQIRDSNQVLLDLADKVAAMKSPAEKTAAVIDLFGKTAGPELLQLLNQGKGGITALTTEAQQMGAVISTETANQAGQFNDALDRAKIASNGLFLTIGKEVLPVLNSFSSKATDAATSGGVLEKSATAVGVAFKTVYTGGAVLGNVLGLIGDQLGKVGAMAAAVASWDFDQLSAIRSDRTAVEQYKASILELGNIWNDVGQSAAVAAQAQDRATGGAGGNASAGAGKGKGKAPGSAGGNASAGLPGAASGAGKPKADKDVSAVDQIRGGLLSPEDRENAQYEKQRRLLETANASAFKSADERHRLLEQLEQQHLQKIQEMRSSAVLNDKEIQNYLAQIGAEAEQRNQAEAQAAMEDQNLDDLVNEYFADKVVRTEEQKRQEMAKTKDFFLGGLDQMAQGQGKAAKAAQALQKAQALQQIAMNTHSAAIGAYNALAPIPIVGPALGVAAAAAAIAFGANMARGVMSGGQPSAPSAPAIRAVGEHAAAAKTLFHQF